MIGPDSLECTTPRALNPWWHLPALLATTLLLALAPGRALAQTQMAVSLCGGGTAPVPGMPVRRDCDPVCHIGCPREKRSARMG
jgi:hypothetical protein